LSQSSGTKNILNPKIYVTPKINKYENVKKQVKYKKGGLNCDFKTFREYCLSIHDQMIILHFTNNVSKTFKEISLKNSPSLISLDTITCDINKIKEEGLLNIFILLLLTVQYVLFLTN